MADDAPLNPGIPEENENEVDAPPEEKESTQPTDEKPVEESEVKEDADQQPAEETAAEEKPANVEDEVKEEVAPTDEAPTGTEVTEETEKTEDAEKPSADDAGEEKKEGVEEPAPAEGDETTGTKPAEEAAEGEGAEGAAVAAPVDGEAPKEGEESEEPKEGAETSSGEATEAAGEATGEEAAEGGEVVAEEAAKDEGGEAGEAVTAEDAEKPSEHFADGERPESPPRVGEKLSREGSPKPEEGQAEGGPEHVPASTPPPDEQTVDTEEAVAEEDEEGEEGEEEEEEEEEMVFDRELLIEKYRQAQQERQQLMQQNNVLQTKLAEYFRKKKADTEGVGKSEMEKSIADQEQRYLKYIANLEDLRRQYSEFQNDYRLQIEELKLLCNDKQEKVDAETAKFMEFKKQTGIKAINSRSGKPIPPKELEGFLANEHKKETEVVQVRLKNIKLQNQLRKEEMALKSKEELAEGLHLIDFEQLKIENQTYNEKIEERNEELLKLRKKITSTVQILTHLKEKLQFVQQENLIQRNKLNDVDSLVAKERDLLTRTKQSRDALRIDNQKLRQNCGLLGNEALLRNFEDCVDTVDGKKKRLDMMRMEHAELTLNYNGLKRKIEQAKSTSALGGRM